MSALFLPHARFSRMNQKRYVVISALLATSVSSPRLQSGVHRHTREEAVQVEIESGTQVGRPCRLNGPEVALIMFSLDLEELTPKQRAMVALSEEHLKAEI